MNYFVFFIYFQVASTKTSLVAQTVKASAYYAGDPSSIPGSGGSPGERKGNPFPFYQRSLVRFLADTTFTSQLFLPSQGNMN